MERSPSRREFLGSATGAVGGMWLARNPGALASLAGCAGDAARRAEPLRTLTSREASTMRAFADRILPAGDGLPRADESGAVHFIDHALGSFFADMLPPVRELLPELVLRARAPVSTFGYHSRRWSRCVRSSASRSTRCVSAGGHPA